MNFEEIEKHIEHLESTAQSTLGHKNAIPELLAELVRGVWEIAYQLSAKKDHSTTLGNNKK